MLAVSVMVGMALVVLAGAVVAVRGCKRILCHRRERRSWDDLVARHPDLDRQLTRIWQRR